MVRNPYYVVRKMGKGVYALPIGQGVVDKYPVMLLEELQWDIVKRSDQDVSPKEIFEELALEYKIAEEERDDFEDDYYTAVEQLAKCNILHNVD